MSTTPIHALIFGPTGAVACHAAVKVLQQSGNITLAMRDPSKQLPSALLSHPSAANLPRIKADLTDLSTLTPTALSSTGATSAFVYTQDNMGPTFAALKAGGIQHIVLLSSATIYPLSTTEAATNSTGKSHAIPEKHAKAELACLDSGLRCTGVRALYFASNTGYQADQVRQGAVRVLRPEGVWDYITPEDIGTVCGAKLLDDGEKIEGSGSDGLNAGHVVVPIVGPELIKTKDAWGIIGKAVGKDVKIEEVSYEEFLAPGGGNRMMESLAIGTVRTDEEKYPELLVKQGRDNMRRYLGRDAMRFEEWVKIHVDEFK